MPISALGSQYSIIQQFRTTHGSSFSSFRSIRAAMVSSYDSHAKIIVGLLASSHRSFQESLRAIYARNSETGVVTKLGEIEEGSTTLSDVALADGFYDIEVRSSGNFWEETRSRVVFPVEISGGVIASQGIPSIRLLRSEITQSYSTKLSWEISDSAFSEGLKFGIWRSPTTPVSVAGAPDFTTQAYDGLGKYSYILTQTADEYFAVAAILGSDQGAAIEVFQPWDLTTPNSPQNQFGYNT